MATNIVQSLFGVSPQDYQQAQQDHADAQALQYAKLDPYQKANFAIGRGAIGLGNAIGGMLGGTDPALDKYTSRQKIASQIDYADPKSINNAMQMLVQSGDTEGALQLRQIGQEIDVKQSEIYKNQGLGEAAFAKANAEKIPPTPEKIQLATTIANLQEQIVQLEQLPISSNRDQALRITKNKLTELQRLTTPEVKDLRFGVDRESISAEVYGVSFAQLSQDQRAAVNLRLEQEQNKKAKSGAGTFVMPGDKALVDIPAFRAKVQSTIDVQSKTINAADQALQSMQDSIITGSFTSYRAGQVQFARAISGAGDLSQRELKAAGADPSLLGGTVDYLSTLFSSTPTADTQNKMLKTLEAIRTVAAKKATTEVEQQRKIALRSPGYNAAAVTEALTFPELAPRIKGIGLSSSDQNLLDKYTQKAQ